MKNQATSNSATQKLYEHAQERIPAGTQLLSKRPKQFAPEQWPAYFSKASGCEVWDLDGNHYYDVSMTGIGACLLGFCDPDVNAAVIDRINQGHWCTQNPPEEVELADRLCQIHPWAQQARFTRAGGEACAVAVRIARATTDRSLMAVCGYHGWHDWYLAANLGEEDALRGHLLPGIDPLGVPRELRGTTLPFNYNNREQFQQIIDQHGDELAAVMMEPCRHHAPEPGFLEFVRDGAHSCGALLIFDEVTIGWRLHFGGAHLKFGVNPDMAVFAKATANGYAMGAVIGTKQAMAGAQISFISSSAWTESIGPTAALATLEKMEKLDVPAHVANVGAQVQQHWRDAAEKHNLDYVNVDDGFPCMPQFTVDHELEQELLTLYTQMMLERGFLATNFTHMTMATTEDIVARYGEAIDEVFGEMVQAIESGTVVEQLKGPPRWPGFTRLVT